MKEPDIFPAGTLVVEGDFSRICTRGPFDDDTSRIQIDIKTFNNIFNSDKIVRMETKRAYPELPCTGREPARAISFVVVRFSDELEHNFLRSECAKHTLNEVIEVNNTSNIFFDNLSQAMSYGVKKTQNDLIIVVHEDVRLIDGWQLRFEQSLAELEKYDDQWAVLGSVGWLQDGCIQGHWSDPFRYANTFSETGLPYCEVERLDEQILIFNRSRLPVFDENLPGIHHIGRDISMAMRKSGLKTYAIDAPTIHKHRDRNGHLVLNYEESEKIRDRESLTYLADKSCCDNYIANKWPELTSFYNRPDEFHIPFSNISKLKQLEKPIILLSRGGSGSRLLSSMVEDFGVFLGNDVSGSGDSLELAIPFYRAITEKYVCKADWQKNQTVPRIRAAAARMIKNLPDDHVWGFKLPESILILSEFIEAFPEATFIHLIRDPETTCLRRTHMTSRIDNHIGRIALPLAYDFLNKDRSQILQDNPAEHMAYTTVHQLELVRNIKTKVPKQRFFEIYFEDLIARPQDEMTKLSEWLDIKQKAFRISDLIDINRANNPTEVYPDNIAQNVKAILADTRQHLGYND